MYTVAGIPFESPEDVRARLESQRQQLFATGNPMAQDAAILNRALDTLFGNPEITKAEATSAAVKAGISEANRVIESTDVPSVEESLIRWKAIKSKLEEVSPQHALAIDDQIMKIENQQMEKRKLLQGIKIADKKLEQMDQRYIFDPDTFSTEMVDIGTSEGRQRMVDAMRSGHLVTKSPESSLNIFNSERAREFRAEQAAISRQARKEEAKLAGAGVFSLPSSTKREMINSMAVNRQMLDAFGKSKTLLSDPEMLQVMGRLKNFKAKAQDLVGIGILKSDEVDRYRELTELHANVASAVNDLIHEKYGAALTEYELERAKQNMPTKDDTPVEFMTKINVLNQIMARANRRIAASLTQNDWRVRDLPGEQFERPDDTLFSPDMFNYLGEVAPVQQQSTNSILFGPQAAPADINSDVGARARQILNEAGY